MTIAEKIGTLIQEFKRGENPEFTSWVHWGFGKPVNDRSLVRAAECFVWFTTIPTPKMVPAINSREKILLDEWSMNNKVPPYKVPTKAEEKAPQDSQAKTVAVNALKALNSIELGEVLDLFLLTNDGGVEFDKAVETEPSSLPYPHNPFKVGMSAVYSKASLPHNTAGFKHHTRVEILSIEGQWIIGQQIVGNGMMTGICHYLDLIYSGSGRYFNENEKVVCLRPAAYGLSLDCELFVASSDPSFTKVMSDGGRIHVIKTEDLELYSIYQECFQEALSRTQSSFKMGGDQGTTGSCYGYSSTPAYTSPGVEFSVPESTMQAWKEAFNKTAAYLPKRSSHAMRIPFIPNVPLPNSGTFFTNEKPEFNFYELPVPNWPDAPMPRTFKDPTLPKAEKKAEEPTYSFKAGDEIWYEGAMVREKTAGYILQIEGLKAVVRLGTDSCSYRVKLTELTPREKA